VIQRFVEVVFPFLLFLIVTDSSIPEAEYVIHPDDDQNNKNDSTSKNENDDDEIAVKEERRTKEEYGTITAPDPEELDDVKDRNVKKDNDIVHQELMDTNLYTRRQLHGAMVGGGVAGMLVGGPIGSVFTAAVAAVAVTTSPSKAGDFARNSGEKVARIGDKLDFSKYDTKYHVMDKAGVYLDKAANVSVKGYDKLSTRANESKTLLSIKNKLLTTSTTSTPTAQAAH